MSIGMPLRIYLVLMPFLWLGQVLAQSPYKVVKLLQNTPNSQYLYSCYFAKFIDSSAYGTAELIELPNAKYELKYTPSSNFLGNDTVVVQYKNRKDASGVLKYASFVFQYIESYLEARSDFIQVEKNSVDQIIEPLLNDSSSISGNNPISLANVNNYSACSATKIAGNKIKFTPETDFEGFAHINYQVCDNLGQCASGVITVSVIDPANREASKNVFLMVPEDHELPIDHDLMNPTVDVQAQHGSVDISALSINYKPDRDFNGEDSLVISEAGLIRHYYIKVLAQDEPGNKLSPDKFSTSKNTSLVFDAGANDVRAILELHPVLIDQAPAKGQLTKLNNTGLFEYIPEAGFEGIQTFSYKICPSGVCEKTTVTLLIGDYQPRTTEAYEFKTHKNQPIVLSYSVPVDAYNFSSSSDSVKFYPGWDTLTVTYGNFGCSRQVIGYNLLIYYPPLNTVLTESFTIDYCITGSDCYTADCSVTVLDESRNCVKQCVGDCVWPGDVDLNGEVNMTDLLHLGYNLGAAGTARVYGGSNYRASTVNNWSNTQMSSFANLKHADTDGNGIVNKADTTAVSNNYKKTHSLVPEPVYERGDFPIDFVVLNPDVDSGDVVLIELRLGDEEYPAINISGYSYELDYNTDVIYEPSLSVDFYKQDWFPSGVSYLNMFKKPYDGRLESGGVRSNARKVSGHGGVEVIKSIVEDDLDPFRGDEDRLIPFYFKNIIVMQEDGSLLQMPDQTKYVRLKKADNDGLDPSKLLVYPNPAKEFLTLQLNGKNNLVSYRLTAVDGKLISTSNATQAKQLMIDVSAVTPGFYILVVNTEFGKINKKIQICR